MSPRMMKMLEMIARKDGVSRHDALDYNQTTFGALCAKDLLDYDLRRNRFFVSVSGFAVLNRFREWTGVRIVNNGKFSVLVPRESLYAKFHERRRTA